MDTTRTPAPRAKLLHKVAICLTLAVFAAVIISGSSVLGQPDVGDGSDPFVVLGYNDLGMHCMNQGFSELCLLPPFNNLHAQVIDRSGEHPRIVTRGVTVSYSIPGNTTSSNKTDFWDYAFPLFGVQLKPDVGLTGNGLFGTMRPTGRNDWAVTGIPITPLDDDMNLNPYPLALIDVHRRGKRVASTIAVVPVSWEISCNLCHNTEGITVETDILRAHDRIHGTKLEAAKPVLCAQCHADPALGAKGDPNVSMMSHAMHRSHAGRMDVLKMDNNCYACHPGFKTQCQRDVHFAKGIYCVDCHGDMKAVGDSQRRPWVDEPKCGDCHVRQGFEFEEPGKLFKESRGHQGVHCAACHGSPHAITPTVTEADNLQAMLHQGYPGVIQECTVCHRQRPHDPFKHRRGDD